MFMNIHHRLSGFYFGYYAMIGIFMPYWNLYLEHLHFDYQHIGWLASIGVITRFFAPFMWGWIADKTAKRMLLIRIACAVECLIWLTIFMIQPNFQSIALLMFIFSFFQNAILAQFESVTAFYLAEQRKQHYAKIRKWGSIGFIFGVFSVGFLLDYFHINILPILLLSVGFFVFLWSLSIAEPSQAPTAQTKLEPIIPVLKQPIVFLFFAIQFLLLFSHAPFYSFYSNYLNALEYSKTQIGILWSLGVIAEIMMFMIAKYFFQRFQLATLIALCLLFTGIRWIIVGLFSHNFIMQLFAQLIHAFSFGLFHLIAMNMINEYFSPQQQGRAQALYSTIWGFGVAFGSILAGYYWHDVGGEYIFIIAGLISLFSMILLYPFQYYLKKGNNEVKNEL